jgi:hypothetical protein
MCLGYLHSPRRTRSIRRKTRNAEAFRIIFVPFVFHVVFLLLRRSLQDAGRGRPVSREKRMTQRYAPPTGTGKGAFDGIHSGAAGVSRGQGATFNITEAAGQRVVVPLKHVTQMRASVAAHAGRGSRPQRGRLQSIAASGRVRGSGVNTQRRRDEC